MDPSTLVSTFNALPRNRLSPSGSVPNHWHISLRHVPLSPPGHYLYMINPQARFIHVEGPLQSDFNTASTELKASMWAMLLLKAFIEGLGYGSAGSVGRPWSWVSNDAEMAGAVGETLRGMGVTAPEGMGVAGEEENAIADEEWERFFGALKGQVERGGQQ